MKKKHLYIAVLALVAILMIALLLGGNYLVSFAIGRSTGTVNVAPESILDEDEKQQIAENWKRQKKQAEDWKQDARVEKAEVQAADGLTLRGEAVISDETSPLWLIAVHGYRGNHTQMEALASYYGLRGYNVLTGT